MAEGSEDEGEAAALWALAGLFGEGAVGFAEEVSSGAWEGAEAGLGSSRGTGSGALVMNRLLPTSPEGCLMRSIACEPTKTSSRRG